MNFYLLSLGCAKNQVDAEVMSRLLSDDGHLSVASPGDASLLIVNTCGFITAAKEEAIASILDLCEVSETTGAYLIVAGCLGQRYADEIYAEFPEVDLVLGTGDCGDIAKHVAMIAASDRSYRPGKPGSISHLDVERQSEHPVYAYIKIAEGCSSSCTYCAIPQIRGPQASRPITSIVNEARRHLEQGRKELILIAQDSTRYGDDLADSTDLKMLLLALDRLPGTYRLRVLYMYTDLIDDDLLAVMRSLQHFVPYFDLPMQHASDGILKRMGRRETAASIRNTIMRIREYFPAATIRTTVMVGFPGETDDDFCLLTDFIEEIAFDRIGCFIYSPEEGTAAIRLRKRVPAKIAERRYETVMALSDRLLNTVQKNRIGSSCFVLIEEEAEDGLCFKGRSDAEAPDADPPIFVFDTTGDLMPGDLANVRIVDTDGQCLTGVTER
jgi:ribosomal protein S12 methylthiotransferase